MSYMKRLAIMLEETKNLEICTHAGEFCDGERHCNTCRKLLVSGYVYVDQHYCEEHRPASWDVEIAAMSEKEFDNQDDMYWTEWSIEDVTCDCSSDCECHLDSVVTGVVSKQWLSECCDATPVFKELDLSTIPFGGPTGFCSKCHDTCIFIVGEL
jgi:hypothetical protein